jgi:intracellular sulfur oxidation DsrE/DsrF family protein
MKRGLFLGSALIGTLPSARAAVAAGVPGGAQLVEPSSAFRQDRFNAVVGRPAEIRQLWENVALKPAVFANIKNSLNGLQFGYGYPAKMIAMAVVNHGPSAAYTYGDAIWAKYRISEYVGYPPPQQASSAFAAAAMHIGELFGRTEAQAAALGKNPFYARKNPANGPSDPNDENSPYQDTSIEALQSRGVVFLTCHTAVMEQAKSLVKGGLAPRGMTPKAVAEDILTHLVPGAIVIPSGVATVAVLQKRFGYVYTTIQ